jgi:hypothetical protein
MVRQSELTAATAAADNAVRGPLSQEMKGESTARWRAGPLPTPPVRHHFDAASLPAGCEQRSCAATTPALYAGTMEPPCIVSTHSTPPAMILSRYGQCMGGRNYHPAAAVSGWAFVSQLFATALVVQCRHAFCNGFFVYINYGLNLHSLLDFRCVVRLHCGLFSGLCLWGSFWVCSSLREFIVCSPCLLGEGRLVIGAHADPFLHALRTPLIYNATPFLPFTSSGHRCAAFAAFVCLQKIFPSGHWGVHNSLQGRSCRVCVREMEK